jgi:fluoride exporter
MSVMGSDAADLPLDPDIDFEPIATPRSGGLHRDRRAQRIIVVAVGVGGVFGAICRYALSLALPTVDGRFPWGTFVINLTGSAVLGFLLILLLEQFPRARLARPVIGTGFIGAYTTFSTFMVETVDLVRDKQPGIAALYLVGSLLGGLAAVWIGMTGARLAVRAERWLQEEMQ